MGLKTFLELRDLTQSNLAEVLGISKASVSRRVAGEVEMTVKDLQSIYEAFSPLNEEEMRALFTE